MTKSLEIIKRVAAGVCSSLILFLTIYGIGVVLAFIGIPLPIDKVLQFLSKQSFTVLLAGGVFAGVFVYLLIMGIVNQPFGIDNSGFAYCYGHRPENESYSERGTLTFEDDRLIFKPYNASSRSYTLFIRYKDSVDNEHVLEIGLPHPTGMMDVVKQKLFNEKVATNS